MSSATATAPFRTTFVVASFAWFMFALDKLVVATALPNIRTDLGAGPVALEWTVNAFTLTFAVLLLTGSAAGDRFGRRRVFVMGMALFTVASALAASASDMTTLVAARALQGAGGALFAPVSLTLLSVATPPARRGAVFGAWGGVGAVGAAIGPFVGGLLTQTVGWRSAFWLNVPLGLVLVPLAWFGLRESHGPDRSLDVTGVLLGTGGLLGLVWGVMLGGEDGWSSPGAYLTLAVGVAVLIGFVAWERRTTAPVLPLGLFASRSFVMASGASLLMYAALFGSLFFVAQIFQTARGESPFEAGLHTMPLALMPVLLSPVSGHLADRWGVRPLLVAGPLTVALGLLWFAVVVQADTPYALVVPGLVLMGAGAALFFGPVTAATQSAAAPGQQGRASGAGTTIREVAAVLGVADIGAVFGAHGDLGSRETFLPGLHAAVLAGAGIALAAALVAAAVPSRARHQEVTVPGSPRERVPAAARTR
jgi:EmrB/QacA subfamily drug resistance transporter